MHRTLGTIIHWPGGYAMTLDRGWHGNNVVRCCGGHPTPEDAKNHGLVRLIEVAGSAADTDIAAWAAHPCEGVA